MNDENSTTSYCESFGLVSAPPWIVFEYRENGGWCAAGSFEDLEDAELRLELIPHGCGVIRRRGEGAPDQVLKGRNWTHARSQRDTVTS